MGRGLGQVKAMKGTVAKVGTWDDEGIFSRTICNTKHQEFRLIMDQGKTLSPAISRKQICHSLLNIKRHRSPYLANRQVACVGGLFGTSMQKVK